MLGWFLFCWPRNWWETLMAFLRLQLSFDKARIKEFPALSSPGTSLSGSWTGTNESQYHWQSGCHMETSELSGIRWFSLGNAEHKFSSAISGSPKRRWIKPCREQRDGQNHAVPLQKNSKQSNKRKVDLFAALLRNYRLPVLKSLWGKLSILKNALCFRKTAFRGNFLTWPIWAVGFAFRYFAANLQHGNKMVLGASYTS